MSKLTNFLELVLVIAMLANIDIAAAVTDSNSSNNQLIVSINVIDTKSLAITFSPVDGPNDYTNQKRIMADFINRTYPIADTELLIGNGPTINSIITERVQK